MSSYTTSFRDDMHSAIHHNGSKCDCPPKGSQERREQNE